MAGISNSDAWPDSSLPPARELRYRLSLHGVPVRLDHGNPAMGAAFLLHRCAVERSVPAVASHPSIRSRDGGTRMTDVVQLPPSVWHDRPVQSMHSRFGAT